ncbi:MAG: hypothetical protein H8D77_00185 [Chloroflexi bacterium]|nr:hypothetical protein [Chloroflexota bacterium]MBL7199288.1 hypothetical protein [Anaerolineae bacterium]
MKSPRSEVERWLWIPSLQQAPDLYAGEARFTAGGERGLLWVYERAGQQLVDSIHRGTGSSTCPVVPNMASYARDTRDRSPIVAMLQRYLRLNPIEMGRVARSNLPKLPDILGKDFSTGVLILAEMEILKCRRYQPEIVYLNNQIVDLAMAFDNQKLFVEFERLVRRRYGLGVGLVTYNYSWLAPKLAQWGIGVERIIAPFNERGYLMHRSQEECERLVPAYRAAIIASEFDAGGTLSEAEALAYVQGLGIQAVASRWSDGRRATPGIRS